MIIEGRLYENQKAYFDWTLQTYMVAVTERTLCQKPRSKRYPFGIDTHRLLITVSTDTPIMAKYIQEGYSCNQIVKEIEEATESIITSIRCDLHPEWIRLISDKQMHKRAYRTLDEALQEMGIESSDGPKAEIRYSPRKK